LDEGRKIVKETNIVQFERGTEQGIVSVGRLTLTSDGTVAAEPEPEQEALRDGMLTNQRVLEKILGEEVMTSDGRFLKKEDDPKLWFRRLPHKYHGSYFWARFV
jgi:hypothetical protein